MGDACVDACDDGVDQAGVPDGRWQVFAGCIGALDAGIADVVDCGLVDIGERI